MVAWSRLPVLSSSLLRRMAMPANRRPYSITTSLQKELPYHLVVGLPALSPTMDSGSLAEWYIGVGDSFSAGDAIAKIETDKASIDFEAQDDGYVAKLILEAGSNDVKVGTPIMITVEEKGHVTAFADYVVEVGAATAVAVKEPALVVAEPPKAAPAPPVVAAPPPPVIAAAPVTASTPPPPPVPVASPPVSTLSPVAIWGLSAATKSPLAKTLASKQKKYIEMYGTTGQLPL